MIFNTYRYEELKVGQMESFVTSITEEKMNLFSRITGDVNPLHTNLDFAKHMGHPGIVVYGMLIASFYSTLAGMYLPGKYSLIHSVESKFLHPVYQGDELTVHGTITEKNDLFELLTIKAEILNQNGRKVSKAVMKVGVIHE